MTFLIYVVGFLIVIGGLIWGAVVMGVDHTWIAIGAVVLLGLGIVTGVTKTRQKDPPEPVH